MSQDDQLGVLLRRCTETEKLMFFVRSQEATNVTNRIDELQRERHLTEEDLKRLVNLLRWHMLWSVVTSVAIWFFEFSPFSNFLVLMWIVAIPVGFAWTGFLISERMYEVKVLTLRIQLAEGRPHYSNFADEHTDAEVSARLLSQVRSWSSWANE